MKRAHKLLALILLLGALVFAQQNPSLAEVLSQNSISALPGSLPHLTLRITSYSVLDEEQEFIIAYYIDDGSMELRGPLMVSRLNKVSGIWNHVELSSSSLGIPEFKDTPIACLGSVLKIQHAASWYYLTLHWNPSAGCFLVLNRDLSVDAARTGGVSAVFESGLAICDGNMVHFADVHPQTLYLYDPASHSAKDIFPQSNDPFRKDFATKLEKVIDQKRCMENNWACMPDRFSINLGYPINVDDRTKAIAFSAVFEADGFLNREDIEDSGMFDDDAYAYIFQLEPFRWREFSIYDLKSKFKTDSLQELISPQMIEKVFATPAPN